MSSGFQDQFGATGYNNQQQPMFQLAADDPVRVHVCVL